MKILVIGKGLVGSEFARQGYEVWGKDQYQTSQVPNFKGYDVIVNCIGKTNTRWCENNQKEAVSVNGVFPSRLNSYCNYQNIKIVHISTGCLYDNWHTPQKETDFLSAHCLYTLSKWLGEMRIDPTKHIILRPRLLFNEWAVPQNFLERFSKFTKHVDNRIDSFTYVPDIVKATQALLDANATGVFNIACQGHASIYAIAELLKVNPVRTTIEEIREQEKLYLVNNTMDISKIMQYYTPSVLQETLEECWSKMYER